MIHGVSQILREEKSEDLGIDGRILESTFREIASEGWNGLNWHVVCFTGKLVLPSFLDTSFVTQRFL
jgi:hypothetical protein